MGKLQARYAMARGALLCYTYAMGKKTSAFRRAAAFVLPLLMAAGCFTLQETEFPETHVASAPQGKDVKVALSGFSATITDYVPVYGYETAIVSDGPYRGRHGRYYGGGLRMGTVTTETLIPTMHSTDEFLRRAQTTFEDAGYLVRASPADFTVEVNFSGPFVTEGEMFAHVCWNILSLLSGDYDTQTWTAKLRIYDNSTGRIAYHRDFKQKYSVTAWSPLPIIGLAGYSKNRFNAMQSWCLTALTDMAVADASAFLAGSR